MLRLTAALALLAALGWSSLLFGIGLDDLTNDRTTPGVVFSLVLLPIVIGVAALAIGRLLRPRDRNGQARS